MMKTIERRRTTTFKRSTGNVLTDKDVMQYDNPPPTFGQNSGVMWRR